jgi:hypothetical protein
MTTGLALDYIPRLMQDRGYGNNYMIQYRHYVLDPKEIRNIEGHNHIYVFIEPSDMIAIQSDTGVYDVSADNINELSYHHEGSIILTNYAPKTMHVTAIQIIPKNNTLCP